jgi:hypothetical protein
MDPHVLAGFRGFWSQRTSLVWIDLLQFISSSDLFLGSKEDDQCNVLFFAVLIRSLNWKQQMKVVRGIVLQPTSSNNRTAVSQHRPLLVSSTDVCNLLHLGCLLSRSTSGLALSEWFCCKFGLCATYAAIQVLPSQIA